jgi:hypothetical protein
MISKVIRVMGRCLCPLLDELKTLESGTAHVAPVSLAIRSACGSGLVSDRMRMIGSLLSES